MHRKNSEFFFCYEGSQLMLVEHLKWRGGNVNNPNPNINVRYKQSRAGEGEGEARAASIKLQITTTSQCPAQWDSGGSHDILHSAYCIAKIN